MKKPVVLLAAAALAVPGFVALNAADRLTPSASAAPVVTGFASQNGGTDGGTTAFDGSTGDRNVPGAVVTARSGSDINLALCNRASSSTPIIIQVEGTINHGNTAEQQGSNRSCRTLADRILLRDVSNVTIVGVGSGATFDQLGIQIRDSRDIIIQNVTIRNVKKDVAPASNGGDAIGMEDTVRNVWVDHVTLEASGGEAQGYDGLFDLKDDVEYVTLSYSILRNSGRGGLVGADESDTGSNNLTFHNNLYQNIEERTPLLRGATAHIYNNHFLRIGDHGINSRAGAKAKIENNYFQDSEDVIGTFHTTQRGTWQVADNIYDNVAWSTPDDEEYPNFPAGPNPTSNTTISIPYTYRLDPANCMPDVVSRTAGANKDLRVSDGTCTPTTPASTPTR